MPTSHPLQRARTLAALVVLSAPPGVVSQSPDHETLRRLKTVEWPQAYRTQNVRLLDRILADDFRVVRSDGSWSSKQEELASLRTNRPTYDSLVFRITRLDVYPNGTAIIAGTGLVHSTSAGQPRLMEYQSTNVLLRQADGVWRAVASHTSGNRNRPPPEE